MSFTSGLTISAITPATTKIRTTLRAALAIAHSRRRPSVSAIAWIQRETTTGSTRAGGTVGPTSSGRVSSGEGAPADCSGRPSASVGCVIGGLFSAIVPQPLWRAARAGYAPTHVPKHPNAPRLRSTRRRAGDPRRLAPVRPQGERSDQALAGECRSLRLCGRSRRRGHSRPPRRAGHIGAAEGPRGRGREAPGPRRAALRGGVAGIVCDPSGVPDGPPDSEREDLAEVLERRALTQDDARRDAVERRHAAGGRTARENIADLVDAGSFVEYGRFAVAAQRQRRDLRELIERTPADGLVAGTARINGDLFGERSACAVLSYDYTVLAGTQGALGHRKKDRLFELIERMRLPTIFFAEGGGGRPGDTDYPVVSALDTRAFALWAGLSGLVPRIAVVKGRCFAGNAAIAGCSDLIVATENVSIGMGGPAMIAGGGLGDVDPDEVGPIEMQAPNGVVDLVMADETEAVDVTKKLLGYFQGFVPEWSAPDQAGLREAVPERERRAY